MVYSRPSNLKWRVYSFFDKQFIYFDVYGDYPQGYYGGVSEPQQCAGFLDKKNHEVFEGDILDVCGGKFEVLWKDFGWKLKSLDEEGYFMGLNNSTNRFCEIVGNIFEEDKNKLQWNDLGFPVNEC